MLIAAVLLGAMGFMGLPKRVRIVEEDLSKDKAWGLCFYAKGLIKIHPYQPMESRMDT
jgi:hypothetical protein